MPLCPVFTTHGKQIRLQFSLTMAWEVGASGVPAALPWAQGLEWVPSRAWKDFPRETHGGHLLFSPTLINSGLGYFHTHTPVYPNLEKHSSSNFGKCGVPKPPQVFHTSDRGQDE